MTLILPERHVAEDLRSHRGEVEEGFGEIGGSVVVGDDLKRFERGDLAPERASPTARATVTTVAKLEHYSFGRIVVDGQEHTRDLIVLPCRVVPNWWRQQGHSLVVQDLEEVRDELPERLIVGCGAHGQLKPHPAVLQALGERGIEVETLDTPEAVKRYRESDERRTAAALHLTC